MTSHDQAAGREPRGGDAGRGSRQGDGDSSLASPAALEERLRRLTLPGPSPDAAGRMEARFTRMVDAGDPGPLARALAWFGFGTTGPRLSPRMAAGALLVLAIGGTASTAAGVSPLTVAARAGEVARSVVTNLDPTSGDDAALAPAHTPTASPEASRSPDTASSTAAAHTSTPEQTRPEQIRTPQPSPSADSGTPDTGTSGGGTTGAVTSGSPEPTEPPDPTETPEVTATPEPGETVHPSETPDSTETPEPTDTPDATATPESTKMPSPTATSTPEPSPTSTPGTGIYPAGSGGSVELARAGDEDLVIVAVVASPGWTVDIEQQSGKKVEVVFKSDGQEIHFTAKVVSGEIEVTIDSHGDGGG